MYGTIPAAGNSGDPSSVSTFAIDAGSSATFAPTPRDDVFQQAMFQSADLQAGEHTLVINSTTERSWFWLDYIVYTPLDEVEDPSATISFNASRSTPTSTSSAAIGSASHDSSATPAIIGGVVGGLAVLVCLVGFLCYWSRRRLKRASTRGAPTPFILESAYGQYHFSMTEISVTDFLTY